MTDTRTAHPQKTAVLLINLGTPDSYSTPDVRRYLTQFLNDPRVIDLSPLSRNVLVNLLIVPFRSSKSAKLYEKIWTGKGSPLLYISEELKGLLQTALGEKFQVELGMRYQNPSIESALLKFKNPVYKKLVVIPLFPQYASASTGTANAEVMRIISQWEIVPPVEFVNSYCTEEGFINAWVERSKNYDLKTYDHIVFSYHGLPERQMKKADPTGGHCITQGCCESLTSSNFFCYRAQCFATTRLLADKLQLRTSDYTISFQSRLGRDPWIKPYTDEILKDLAKKGKKKILVFAPAFVADCLETIYEIGVEYEELLKHEGGEKVQLVESLNTHPAWVNYLKEMVHSKMN